MKKQTLKPNGKNIEIALELLELSLALKKSVKKADIKKLKALAQKHYLLTKLESLVSR